MFELPEAPLRQQASWQAVFDIHRRLPVGWVLAGGQAVYLHAVSREAPYVRPTDDADVVMDIRGHGRMLHRFTGILEDLAFRPTGESFEGHQHRWVRGDASVDVLIPRWTGERAESRKGSTGGTTRAAPGGQQAIDTTETLEVSMGGAVGQVNVVNYLGCLIGKAAALRIMVGPGRERHLTDALVLLSTLRASDTRGIEYSPSERGHLANLLGHLRANPQLQARFPDADAPVARLAAFAGAWNPRVPNRRLR